MTEQTFGKNEHLKETWRKLLFGLTFFHAVVQERRKYGALGFNIRYEFNDSDLETTITMLEEFMKNAQDPEELPWEAMKFMFGHINYGGRVTDDWDRVLLLNLLQRFFSIDDLEENYTFTESGKYFIPDFNTLSEYRSFIDELPSSDDPEIFGLNNNANIVYMQKES